MFTADKDGAGAHNFALVLGFETGVYDIDNVVVREEAPPADGALYINGDFEKGGLGGMFRFRVMLRLLSVIWKKEPNLVTNSAVIEVTALPENLMNCNCRMSPGPVNRTGIMF